MKANFDEILQKEKILAKKEKDNAIFNQQIKARDADLNVKEEALKVKEQEHSSNIKQLKLL